MGFSLTLSSNCTFWRGKFKTSRPRFPVQSDSDECGLSFGCFCLSSPRQMWKGECIFLLVLLKGRKREKRYKGGKEKRGERLQKGKRDEEKPHFVRVISLTIGVGTSSCHNIRSPKISSLCLMGSQHLT